MRYVIALSPASFQCERRKKLKVPKTQRRKKLITKVFKPRNGTTHWMLWINSRRPTSRMADAAWHAKGTCRQRINRGNDGLHNSIQVSIGSPSAPG
jgi:hypothetical protein